MNYQCKVLALAIAFLGCRLSDTSFADNSSDSVPTSHESPEGVATDLVQAFISRDFHGFNEARVKTFCEGRTDPFNYYVGFRNFTTLFISGDPIREVSVPSELLQISCVHSARPLITKEEIEVASAFRVPGLEPTLVDVVIEDRLGNELLHRTIVFKAKDSGLWYAIPQLYTHDYIEKILLKMPKSESVFWRRSETSHQSK